MNNPFLELIKEFCDDGYVKIKPTIYPETKEDAELALKALIIYFDEIKLPIKFDKELVSYLKTISKLLDLD